MATSLKVPTTNVAATAVTPKLGNWASATIVASSTSLEPIKSIRGSLLIQHAGGYSNTGPATLLAVVVDAFVSAVWTPLYTTGVEGAPAAPTIGPPIALKAGTGNLTEVLEIPTLNLDPYGSSGTVVATGKRFRVLAFGPGAGNFNFSGELHGHSTPLP